ncbi:MAG: M3 family metallopeptidase [Neisseriaceae bacterium]|nr:M3 family metallopeptidase [Neisseriaceae bacterium]
MNNPLLQLNEIPQFDALKAEHIQPAMQTAMNEARLTIAEIKNQNDATWENTITPLTDLSERVGRIWGVVAHINSVADTPEWRDAYNALIPEVTQFFTEISQDQDLYQRYKSIRNSSAFAQRKDEEKRKLEHDLRDFVLSGAELPEDKQKRFADLQSLGAQLSASFSQNVLDATDAFSLLIEDKQELSGLPESMLQMLQQNAEAHHQTGYLIGLQMPHYLAIMQFADNRNLREKIYRAYIKRASDLDSEQRDNTPHINQILQTSAEEALLLDYPNGATLSLVTKMADTPKQVIDFLRDLVKKARPFAEKEMQELRQWAKEQGLSDTLQPWDIAYYSEKLRESRYAFSEEEVKQYFPATDVLQGLFHLIEELYQVTFHETNRPVWHPDVRYFTLMRNNQEIGGIYLDLYARQGKKSGAWMNDYCGRRRCADGHLQLPIAYLVCNFAPPVDGKAYLSHHEIVTLFHEMGHGLHHLLTQIEELGVSGINGVEWDAVELPSQLMENFAWEYDVLSSMSCHKTTQEKLPEALFAKMKSAKNFQTGMFVVRQMEFALFDLLIYSEKQQPCQWQEILNQVRQEVSVIPVIEENRFAHSFSHIFAGGYSAGYYSYIWAEILSADIYAAFEEENNRSQTGKRFWQEILSRGGSRSASENFKAFRGREPQSDALLKQLGLVLA